MIINTHFIDEDLAYDGQQLSSFWIRRQTGLTGDAMVSFIGQARVSDHMVDMEDREKKDFIYSPLMLHFILEHFHMPLGEAVVRQRLLMAMIVEEIHRLQSTGVATLTRDGDDLFFAQRKLSVSIATLSPMSALVHIGLNVRTEGTPVPTAGLAELKVDPNTLANRVMQRYQSECVSMAEALTKVLPVS